VKRKRYGFLAILAVVILCCSVWCITGFAEESGVIRYRWMPAEGGDILGTETFDSFEDGWNAAMEKCEEGYMVEVFLQADWHAVDGKFAETDGIGFRDNALYVRPGAKLVLDLNKFTLDRGLNDTSAQKDIYGEIIYVDQDAEVTIKDGNVTGGRGKSAIVLCKANATIEYVNVYGNTVVDGKGAAIYAEGGSLELSNSEFYENSAEGTGESYGTVFLNAVSKVEISHCVFKENKNFAYGGGLCLDACEDVEITNCEFEKIRVTKNGGALWLRAVPKVFVSYCGFQECSANDGGAIYGESVEGTVEDCIFDKNQAANNGGALYMCSWEGHLGGCRLTENKAGKDGGALYLDSAEKGDKAMSFVGGNLLKNTASGNGGGVYVKGTASSKYTLNGTAVGINGNTAGGSGGGIYLESHNMLTLWSGAAITSNTAKGNGGGVYAEANTKTLMQEKAEVRYNRNADGAANNFYVVLPGTITFSNFTCGNDSVGISHPGERGIFATVLGEFNREAVFCDDDGWSIQNTNRIGGTLQLRLERETGNTFVIIIAAVALVALGTFVIPMFKKKKKAV